MMPVVFQEEAHKEMIAAAQWYNYQRTGAGAEFLDEINVVLERITSAPDAFAFFRGKVQYLRLHRFPYAVLYYRKSESIFIVAVMHLHREPSYWEERLPKD